MEFIVRSNGMPDAFKEENCCKTVRLSGNPNDAGRRSGEDPGLSSEGLKIRNQKSL